MSNLTEEDKEFLNGNFEDWKPVDEEGKQGLIIRDYQPPPGYKPDQVDLMLLIPAEYPMAQLDMFYFAPGISREDGFAINALADESHFLIRWQRWSRHYEWRPGVDNVASHVAFIRNQLTSELRGGA